MAVYSRDGAGAAKLNTPPKHATADMPSRITAFYPPGYYAEPIGRTDDPCTDIDQNFHCFNERLAQGFAASPLRHYRLQGTQWEVLNSGGRLLPEILGNATMESFSQNTSSCQSCHCYARPDRPGAARGTLDFLFSFNRDVLQRTVPVQGLD